MRRFTTFSFALAMAMAAASGAVAAPPGGSAAPSVNARQVVMWCESGAMARRAFEREHGRTQIFVSADQVLAARRAGETWDAPRCMTAREHARLSRTLAGGKTGA